MAAVRQVLKRAARTDICTSPIAFQPQRAIARTFGTTAPLRDELYTDTNTLPRWQNTPGRMQMPFRVRPLPAKPIYSVNSNPDVLHSAYDAFLGRRDAYKLLPEELRWQAVTHKSFDHGRRGSNDKLAFLGKRLVNLQCSLSLLNNPSDVSSTSGRSEGSLALKGLENLHSNSIHDKLERTRVAKLAREYRLDRVIRWKPRNSENLRASGKDTVLAHTLYSIIGAILLHRGGEAATEIVNKRVLGPLEQQLG